MKISTINTGVYYNKNLKKQYSNSIFLIKFNRADSINTTSSVINFKSVYTPEKTVPDIAFEEYKNMSEVTKQR